jgi:hypothetical protein
MTQTSPDTFAAFVGIDWADAKHDICLQAAGIAKRECCQLEHTPEAFDAWVTTLRIRFSGRLVAICLELTKGPIVSALCKYDFGSVTKKLLSYDMLAHQRNDGGSYASWTMSYALLSRRSLSTAKR